MADTVGWDVSKGLSRISSSVHLSVWYFLTASLLAASGPLYIDRIIDPLHIVVITREGELLLLERRPDDDPVASSSPRSITAADRIQEKNTDVTAGQYVFASERENGRLLLDGNGQQTAWVAARSLGWNPRKTIRYWCLILLGGLALSPLVVWAWRRFYTATDLISVRYSHGLPPDMRPGEREAVALPRGWRSWAAGVSSAALAVLGGTALTLMALMSLVVPGNVDPVQRPTAGVVATDLLATTVGMTVILWLFAGYATSIWYLCWSITRRVAFFFRHRTRTTASLRHAGTVTIDTSGDASVDKLHLLVYAFTAPHQERVQTYVVREAVPTAADLAVGQTMEVEYVTADPSVILRL